MFWTLAMMVAKIVADVNEVMAYRYFSSQPHLDTRQARSSICLPVRSSGAQIDAIYLFGSVRIDTRDGSHNPCYIRSVPPGGACWPHRQFSGVDSEQVDQPRNDFDGFFYRMEQQGDRRRCRCHRDRVTDYSPVLGLNKVVEALCPSLYLPMPRDFRPEPPNHSDTSFGSHKSGTPSGREYRAFILRPGTYPALVELAADRAYRQVAPGTVEATGGGAFVAVFPVVLVDDVDLLLVAEPVAGPEVVGGIVGGHARAYATGKGITSGGLEEFSHE